MTVKQLMETLKLYPPDTLVRMMSDPEGNDEYALDDAVSHSDNGDPATFCVMLYPGYDQRQKRGEV